jgi:S1-C subfamily serine protease
MQMSTLPVAAPLDTDFAGKGAQIACHSVMHVVNPKAGMVGTAFLHSSGGVITAEHVVKGAGQTDIVLTTAQGKQIKSKSVHSNAALSARPE